MPGDPAGPQEASVHPMTVPPTRHRDVIGVPSRRVQRSSAGRAGTRTAARANPAALQDGHGPRPGHVRQVADLVDVPPQPGIDRQVQQYRTVGHDAGRSDPAPYAAAAVGTADAASRVVPVPCRRRPPRAGWRAAAGQRAGQFVRQVNDGRSPGSTATGPDRADRRQRRPCRARRRSPRSARTAWVRTTRTPGNRGQLVGVGRLRRPRPPPAAPRARPMPRRRPCPAPSPARVAGAAPGRPRSGSCRGRWT